LGGGAREGWGVGGARERRGVFGGLNNNERYMKAILVKYNSQKKRINIFIWQYAKDKQNRYAP